jgi:hypothetical protein
MTYSFDILAKHVTGLLLELGIEHYTLYMQDFGAPVGYRMLLYQPKHLNALIVQNANAYLEGLTDARQAFFRNANKDCSPKQVAALYAFVDRDAIINKQYLRDVKGREATVSPDSWTHDLAFLQSKKDKMSQVQLFQDYYNNILVYPQWQAFLRRRQQPTPIVWGKNDRECSCKDSNKHILVLPEYVGRCQGALKFDGIINHSVLFRDDFGFPCHPPQMMPRIAAVLLYPRGVRLADPMPVLRQHRSECVPVVGVGRAARQVLDLVVEPSEGCNITTTDHPGNSAPCATIQRLDGPALVFFEPTKCHISSNSISWMPPGTSGSGKLAAASVIHRHISDLECPNSLPSIPKDAFPTLYKITARAFFAANESLTRRSPSTKFSPQPLHLCRNLPLTTPFLVRRSPPHRLQFNIAVSTIVPK